MSSGCIPSKRDRGGIYLEARRKVRMALRSLEKIKHPDDDPRGVEAACAKLREAIGEYGLGDYEPALDDLLEHYFS